MSIVLFHSPRMKEMANHIVRSKPDLFQQGQIVWGRYQEGFPNTNILQPEQVQYADVAFLACFNTMGAILEQLWTIASMIRRHKVNSMHIFLPCFPTGTKDRWEADGEVVTAYELAQTFKLLPMTRSGPIDLSIFDIHALQEESYFPSNIRVDRRSAMPLFRDHLSQGISNVAVAFPDEGAYKRFHKYFDGFERIVCEKRRLSGSDEKVVTIKEGDPRGRHVFILDDLGLSAKTSIMAKQALVEAGASEVSLFVSHGMFPGKGLERAESAGFSEIWITDSWPDTVEKVNGRKPWHIMPLDTPIAEILTENYSSLQLRRQ